MSRLPPPSPFPAWVSFEHEVVSERALSELLPAEAELLAAFSHPGRRQELASGRVAARRALCQLGGAAVEILGGPGREPLWPEGYVGSITHKAKVAIAAVAPAREAPGIGIDLENLDQEVSQGIAGRVLTSAEELWLGEAIDAADAAARLRMSFSAKESIFKALYPLEQVWFGYHDAELIWSADQTVFRARLLRDVAAGYREGAELQGRCQRSGAWILTSVLLPLPGGVGSQAL